jgi:CO/xanthine dehydrogenase Mo-binding subunit
VVCSSGCSSPGRLTVRTGCNVPRAVRAQLADTFGIGVADVRVIVPPTGGGFGGKDGVGAIEAARLARGRVPGQRPAHATGADPLRFRLDHLADQRLVTLVRAAAARFGRAPGRERAACAAGASLLGWKRTVGSRTCAEGRARPAGRLSVSRIVTAYECGAVVNPDTITGQIECGHDHGARRRAPAASCGRSRSSPSAAC